MKENDHISNGNSRCFVVEKLHLNPRRVTLREDGHVAIKRLSSLGTCNFSAQKIPVRAVASGSHGAPPREASTGCLE